jgi:hypothetical protein
MKTLYTFTVNKKEVANETVSNPDGTQTVTPVTKEIPVEINLKLLSRRDKERLAVVYNAECGKAMNEGLQPWDTLKKSVMDSGGIYAKRDFERMDEIIRTIQAKSNEVQKAVVDGAPIEDLEREISDLLTEYAEYEKPKTELFSRSAEYEAKKNTIIWALLNFTAFKGPEYLSVFPGSTTESRLNYYYQCCDEDKQFEQEVFDKAYLCYHHYIETDKTDKDYYDALIGK